MKTTRPIRHTLAASLLCLSLFGTASAADVDASRVGDQTLPLFGIGLAQELRTNLYIGALYLPEGARLESATDAGQPRRLSFKVVAERLSGRELSRHWKQRITLNSPPDVWKGQVQAIGNFAEAFKDGLQRGDRVDIDHVPGSGVSVSINGQRVTSIRSQSFFNLLLATWIGDIPATQAFKNGISGKLDAKAMSGLKTEFEALVATPRAIAVQEETPEPDTKVAAKPEPAKPEPAKADAKADAKTRADAAKPDSKVAAKPEAPKPEPLKTEPARTEPAKTEPVRTDTASSGLAKAETAKADTASAPSPATAAPATVAQGTPPVSQPASEPAAQPAAASQTIQVAETPAIQPAADAIDPDLLLGEYRRSVMPNFRKFQVYPPRAFKERLEGSGTVRATVDRSGNLLSVEVIESTGERLLDRAMTDMVNKAMPLPPVPAELPGDSFPIDLPVVFRLQAES